MTKVVTRWRLALPGTSALAAIMAALPVVLGFAAMVPQTARAQAGGGLAGRYAPGNAPFDDGSGPPEPSQCIRRAIDNRRSVNADSNQLTAWISVRRPVSATILTDGSANGEGMGSLSISVLLNDIPIAHSPENRGPRIVSTHIGTNVNLYPGRQYKITAKAMPSATRRLDLFRLNVGVGNPCL